MLTSILTVATLQGVRLGETLTTNGLLGAPTIHWGPSIGHHSLPVSLELGFRLRVDWLYTFLYWALGIAPLLGRAVLCSVFFLLLSVRA